MPANASASAGTAGTSEEPVAEQAQLALGYMFDGTPALLLALWVVGVLCAVAAIGVSLYSIQKQRVAAMAQGFGKKELTSSYGPRADRIILLLLVPPVCALSAAFQMFVPGSAPLMSLARTCQFAFATLRMVELLFLLIGSQQHLVANLPQEPAKIFANPPCCCLAFGPCMVKPRLQHLQNFMLGVQQFGVILPAVSLLQVYISQMYSETNSLSTVINVVVTVSTLLGSYSYGCLTGLMNTALDKQMGKSINLGSMENFVKLQMVSGKLLDAVLGKVILTQLTAANWVMPQETLLIIVQGFATCVVQLILAVCGLKAYAPDEVLYPPVDKAQGFPPDAVALLDLNGVDPADWNQLTPMLQAMESGSGSPRSPKRPLISG